MNAERGAGNMIFVEFRRQRERVLITGAHLDVTNERKNERIARLVIIDALYTLRGQHAH